MSILKFETMCFLLSAREVLDDVPTSSAHAIHVSRTKRVLYRSLTSRARLLESLGLLIKSPPLVGRTPLSNVVVNVVRDIAIYYLISESCSIKIFNDISNVSYNNECTSSGKSFIY